ncbi:MAG: VTT domain-containing protein [Lysobacteraceae bacterium]
MNSQTLENLVAWIGQHPILAGIVIFLIAFCDAVVILGFLVPAIPLLFAIGALIGLGSIDGPYAIVCAGLGAFCGDGLSYLLGRYYGDSLRRIWPFSRHPEWLSQGEAAFRRHGLKSILIARYVGAIRPLVPAIAGMVQMPARLYVPPSLLAGMSWGAVFLIPGWIFGASLDLFAAVAGRLAIVVGVLLALLALIYFTVHTTYRALAPRTALFLSRLLRWSVRHPVLGRFAGALIDPRRRESPSLLVMAILLIFGGWALFTVLLMTAGNSDSPGLDLHVHHLMFGLRTPLADHWMATLAALGDWQVLLPSALVVLGWLCWRRRWVAAGHWIGAAGFGVVLVWVLDALIQVPRPPAAMAAAGFDFPSVQVTMATIIYGFFAVLIARELPGRRRAWPYGVAAVLVGTLAFARLYLGAHWLTDVLGGVFLGIVWIAVLGLAYRRRVTRSFWMRPMSLLFYLSVLGFGLWHGSRSADETLARFEPPQIRTTVAADDWWQRGWQELPARRNEFLSERAWPLNLQYAGDITTLRDQLIDAGWEPGPPAGPDTLLAILDKHATPETLPVLPASHNGHGDALLLSYPGPSPDTRLVLHLWFAPLALAPDDTPVWQGTATLLQFGQELSLFRLWRVQPDSEPALAQLERALPQMAQQRVQRSGEENGSVLLLRGH